ncbi:MAG: hypothetical protein ACRBCJ_14280 [Hyphomicrobiaceae bacterium]
MTSKQPANEDTDPPFRTRLSVLFATAAPKAVILRRGPKRHFNLISWDLETDTFVSGQWMKGIVRLCDLSPLGDHLIYWAAQYHASAPRDVDRPRASLASDGQIEGYDPLTAEMTAAAQKKYKRRKVPAYLRGNLSQDHRDALGQQGGWRLPRENQGVWTAISRPPYFSALAIWPAFGHWTGGGLFRGENDIVLWESEDGMVPHGNVPIPKRVKVQAYEDAQKHGSLPEAWTKPAGNREALVSEYKRIETGLEESGARFVDWIVARPGEDLLFACDGCVYRLSHWHKIPASDYLKSSDLLADFTGLQFQLKPPPPEALEW